MPIPPEHIKERLSISYVSAIAAKAGVVCRPTTAPEYGTDVHFVRVRKLSNGKYSDTGHILNCQVKATTTSEISGDQIVYDMDADDYNKLAEWEGGTCVLVLFCLPENDHEWLTICEDELTVEESAAIGKSLLTRLQQTEKAKEFSSLVLRFSPLKLC